jgi:hypothetical protein
VTHPFHPLFGRVFVLVDLRLNWGESRVCLHDEDGALFSLPTGWTDAGPIDVFAVVAAGRCPFPTTALLELAALIDGLCDQRGYVTAVREITPCLLDGLRRL